MLRIIATVIVVLIAGVLILAATKPDTFSVQRAAGLANLQAATEK